MHRYEALEQVKVDRGAVPVIEDFNVSEEAEVRRAQVAAARQKREEVRDIE